MLSKNLAQLEEYIRIIVNSYSWDFCTYVVDNDIVIVAPFTGPKYDDIQITATEVRPGVIRLHDGGAVLEELQSGSLSSAQHTFIERVLDTFRIHREKDDLYVELTHVDNFLSTYTRLLAALLVLTYATPLLETNTPTTHTENQKEDRKL